MSQPMLIAALLASHGMPFGESLVICFLFFGMLAIIQVLIMNRFCK
jgi:hypothetical protein